MILYCVRHGESVYNAEGRIQGHEDVPLSELGLRQAEAAAAALAGLPIEAVYSSPLRRAFDTARPIAEALGLTVQIDSRLIEIDVDVFQAKTRAELKQQYADVLARWRSGDPDYALPGGESRREVARRGVEALRAICQSGHRQVAVVAHGGVIVAAIKSLLGIPLERPPFALENASVTRLSWEPDDGVRLVAFNQTDHLRSIGRGTAGDLAV